jgi:hypothetical protein
MATPMTAAQFAAALRAEGVRVVEVGDWQNHNRNHMGPWGPVHGVMIHHTVTSGSAETVGICRTGYSSLPGPLCQGVITKDGTVHLIGYGRANHAGSGDPDVLAAVINEQALPADDEATTDGNRHFYGFECENLGDGEDPWPAVQLEAIERAAAAICRHHGWSERSVLGHMEWQPGKVDPRGFTMASMRGRVAARLDNQQQEEDDVALSDADKKWIADTVRAQAFAGVWKTDAIGAPADAPDVKTNPTWQAQSILRDVQAGVRALRVAEAGQSAAIAKLASLVGSGVDTAEVVAAVRQEIRDAVVRVSVEVTGPETTGV